MVGVGGGTVSLNCKHGPPASGVMQVLGARGAARGASLCAQSESQLGAVSDLKTLEHLKTKHRPPVGQDAGCI